MKPKFFKSKEELRIWFSSNHEKLDESWIGYFKKSSNKPSITWDESVAVALCFGWIDGIRKSINEECYKIRFTPRRPNSNWSPKNIKTVNELIEKELMHPAGIRAFEIRKPESSDIYLSEQKKTL